IQADTLAASFPASRILSVLQESHRVLAPDGVMEFRIVDPLPDPKTVGNLLNHWIEEYLLLNLEKSFRCSRPSLLVPMWIREAGFVDYQQSELTATDFSGQLSCIVQKFPAIAYEGASVDERLQVEIGHMVWQTMWGDFVKIECGMDVRWWEDNEVRKECLERNAQVVCKVFRVRKLPP
ncbi:uncharacterized protein BDR25DRAFT_245667, partial [Lindgomyces ingoldianus]